MGSNNLNFALPTLHWRPEKGSDDVCGDGWEETEDGDVCAETRLDAQRSLMVSVEHLPELITMDTHVQFHLRQRGAVGRNESIQVRCCALHYSVTPKQLQRGRRSIMLISDRMR